MKCFTIITLKLKTILIGLKNVWRDVTLELKHYIHYLWQFSSKTEETVEKSQKFVSESYECYTINSCNWVKSEKY